MAKSKGKKPNSTPDIYFQGLLFPVDDENLPSRADVKSREQQYRGTAQLYTEKLIQSNFQSIILPPRWEALQQVAKNRNVPLKPLIMPVSDAIFSIERELLQVQETGMGRLYVISGVTGSGKTTFLNSLNYFLPDITIHNLVQLNLDNSEAISDRLIAINRSEDKYSVVVMEGREAEGSLESAPLDRLLTALNADFRRKSGHRTLFVIPTTSSVVAQQISKRAEEIGGMTSRSRPFYIFNGPARDEYIPITNATLRALNQGRTLSDYGVSDALARDIAAASNSIGSFMMTCHEEVFNRQEHIIKAAGARDQRRKNIHLWMVFCSLEQKSRYNHDIIRALTSGNSQHAQVERLLVGDSKEVREWDGRHGAFALAAQYLDLRITYLPMRTAVAVTTAFGDREFVQHLKQIRLRENDPSSAVLKREGVRSSAIDSIAGTAIGAFLLNEPFKPDDLTKRQVSPEHQIIFPEIIKRTSSDDKSINAAVAQALREWIKNWKKTATVHTELDLTDNGTLKADIAVITPTDIYCLEMKWRSAELQDSEVTRETAGRVSEYARELPELKHLLASSDNDAN
jgi:hypothetical protein